MKYSAKVMSFVMALSVTTSMVPQSYGQTSPAATPAQQQTPAQQKDQAKQQQDKQQQDKQQQDKHPKAKGAAAGAAIGAATTGNAARGAVIGAGHSRRQARRDSR